MIKDNIMADNKYEAPSVEIIYIEIQGVICGSNEPIGENEGEW